MANTPVARCLSRAEIRERWRRHVAEYERGALSQREFCRSRGLALSSFTRWRRLLATQRTDPERGVDEKAPSRFVAVRVAPAPPAANAALRLTLPNGVRIEGVEEGNVALVVALLAEL